MRGPCLLPPLLPALVSPAPFTRAPCSLRSWRLLPALVALAASPSCLFLPTERRKDPLLHPSAERGMINRQAAQYLRSLSEACTDDKCEVHHAAAQAGDQPCASWRIRAKSLPTCSNMLSALLLRCSLARLPALLTCAAPCAAACAAHLRALTSPLHRHPALQSSTSGVAWSVCFGPVVCSARSSRPMDGGRESGAARAASTPEQAAGPTTSQT